MLTCTKYVRHSLPPAKYTHNRSPQNKSIAHQYTPATAITLLLYTIIQTFATTKAASDTGVVQILIFIINKIFHKIYIFCCKCGLWDTSDTENFWGVLTMPGYGMSQHSKTQ